MNVHPRRADFHSPSTKFDSQSVGTDPLRVNVDSKRVNVHFLRLNVHSQRVNVDSPSMNVGPRRAKVYSLRVNVESPRVSSVSWRVHDGPIQYHFRAAQVNPPPFGDGRAASDTRQKKKGEPLKRLSPEGEAARAAPSKLEDDADAELHAAAAQLHRLAVVEAVEASGGAAVARVLDEGVGQCVREGHAVAGVRVVKGVE